MKQMPRVLVSVASGYVLGGLLSGLVIYGAAVSGGIDETNAASRAMVINIAVEVGVGLVTYYLLK